MTILLSCYFFVLGLLLGSFFNVVGMRVPAKESIIFPGSYCPNCKTPLKGRDLIPVLSFLISRAKCRYCQVSVSWLYPLGETVTGLLFLWVYLRFGLTLEGLNALILVSLVVIISISDLKYMLIPNKILLYFSPVILLTSLGFPLHTIWSYLLGAIVGGGIILLIIILTRGGMGMGDAKLFFLCGWFIGFPYILLALFIASLLGTLIGGILLLLKVVKRKQPIPFGPFLALGTLIAFGYGSDIVDIYLSIFENGM
ncbi:prepilin peptidase [Paenibacillus psychroresistens]|uniref:Prepilin peptidase n=1 Tax=Paenibacillus psychroresistens TaxID=1778678 RepID=A0A6B8RMU7_9BACL|nr:A24 family peptidase [Paenibacillus psychroresistens]QGQ96688.1 prepilin peptidase [Paenibacillus psychroresistens]